MSHILYRESLNRTLPVAVAGEPVEGGGVGGLPEERAMDDAPPTDARQSADPVRGGEHRRRPIGRPGAEGCKQLAERPAAAGDVRAPFVMAVVDRAQSRDGVDQE